MPEPAAPATTAPSKKRTASEMSPGLTGDYPTVPKSKKPETTDVIIVGAGPAGLMLATQLTRFGVSCKIIDDRPDRTTTGRADGLQPKTIETFQQMRIAEPLLRRGVKIFDISFWNSTRDSELHRTGRQAHFPPLVDVLEPYILLAHQGMVEEVFVDDLAEHGVQVGRSCAFDGYRIDVGEEWPVEMVYKEMETGEAKTVRGKYLVGCDGAHSAVRRCMPGVAMEGESTDVFWGVLDGFVDTDFPDLWTKCAISSFDQGTILCIPRERGMTRFYIELQAEPGMSKVNKAIANQEFVMHRAKEIMKPYTVEWKKVDWFGVYQVGQRVASAFSDRSRVFISGDAGHTHSPKAAQGMNVSMHDSYNLAWKLASVVHGVAKPNLLDTYADERRKIACDLIRFDHGHAKAFVKNDAKALAENFKTNIRFISGVGAVYASNMLNLPNPISKLVPGERLPPARATRYVDTNPVDLQLDIPVLGQFRIYFLTPDFSAAKYFLDVMGEFMTSTQSILGRASAIETRKPCAVDSDEYIRPDRYTATGRVFTPALVTATPQSDFEIEDLSPMMQDSRWTVYCDNLEVANSPLRRKWLQPKDVRVGETVIVIVRPDGYVGAVSRCMAAENSEAAGAWLESYFGAFLSA